MNYILVEDNSLNRLIRLISRVIITAFLFASLANVAWGKECAVTDNNSAKWAEYFRQADVQGTFVLYDLKADCYIYYDQARANRGFVPASSFKIMSSLVALETGVAKDLGHTLKWDGTVNDVHSWNADQTLKSAFQNSVVCYYKELVAQIGPELMQEYLYKVDYGNRKMSGTQPFWIRGDLRISPQQQVDFLRRLYNNQLPFSYENMQLVKELMLREQSSDRSVRGKTGWSTFENREVGWYVGYVEKGENVYFFALNLNAAVGNQDFVSARVNITNKILKDLNI